MAVLTPVTTHPTIDAAVPDVAPATPFDFKLQINARKETLAGRDELIMALLEKLQDALGEGALTGGTVTAGVGLSVSVAAGTAFLGYWIGWDASVVVGGLADGASGAGVNRIWLRQDATFTVTQTGVEPTTADGHGRALLWATATTAAGAVTAVDNAVRVAWTPAATAYLSTLPYSSGDATLLGAHLADFGIAPVASPGLTGVPTAPTAAPGTNTTQLANTAFVAAAIAALIDASPGALDTLNELAAALGDDANYAATITAALALKAPLASPTLTGTPAAPTAAPGTNTTQLATTAFVAAAAALLATIASPTFTGTPAAPTAAPGTNTTQLATTAFVAALGALKANLASPTLTGTPAAPTAAPGTNTTQLATTAFVGAAITAQGDLATQAELDAHTGAGNPHTDSAPLASPALTGNPTAPTQSAGNNTTRLATTAFVQQEIVAAMGDLTQPFVEGSANADTSGATLGDLETEVNELKALLRSAGILAT